jgi:hypothetical protein
VPLIFITPLLNPYFLEYSYYYNIISQKY